MMKRSFFAVLAIFLAWSILDFLIHGLLLKPTYQATASLWRPEAEMKMGFMSLVTVMVSLCFVAIYSLMIEAKSWATGLKYGVLFGLGAGTSMGFGSYCFMPISLFLASTWCLGTLVEFTVAGAIVGFVIRKPGVA